MYECANGMKNRGFGSAGAVDLGNLQATAPTEYAQPPYSNNQASTPRRA
jgi:hypothetical protein